MNNKYLTKIAGPLSTLSKRTISTMENDTPSKAANLRRIISRMSFPAKKGYLGVVNNSMGHNARYGKMNARINIKGVAKP